MFTQRYLFLLLIGLMLMGLGFLSLQPRQTIQAGGQVPPASTISQIAAPHAPSKTLYLPLLMNACGAKEILQDGGMELGLPNPYWKTTSNMGSSILDNTSNPPAHSGSWKAWLGGSDLAQESVYQPITVPAGINSLRASYWWRVDTFEVTHPFDYLYVQLRNPGGTFTQTLEILSDGYANANYRQSILFVSGAWISQTMQIAFLAQTDASNVTNFFIDDVSVQAMCPP